ncbi:MAG: hypothetical protein AAF226_09770, partial [Verrucomicrobiota bacterium]
GGSRENMAYLRANMQGHTTLQTDHGTFLVRLDGIDLGSDNRSYVVHLAIGNPNAIEVNQFSLRGDYGKGVPTLPDGTEYSLYDPQFDEWQRDLEQFDFRFTQTLTPNEWTNISVRFPVLNRDELELMRFDLVVENAQLEDISGAGTADGTYSHMDVGSDAATILETDFGSFLIVVKSATESRLGGSEIELEIGNPYGFAINQARFVGDYGPAIPQRKVGEDKDQFRERLREWSAQLQPFETTIESTIASFRWNAVKVKLPGKPSETQFLRGQLRIEDLTLPRSKQR